MSKRWVIGVTGGIATGKTTVMRFLKQQGIPGISSDDLAHAALNKGRRSYRQVVRLFGPSVLDRKRQIDRRALGKRVFSDPALRRKLEAIVHPEVIRGLQRFIRRHKGLIALDIPLLFEARLQRMVDHIVVVTASPVQQGRRLKRRNGLTASEIRQRLRAQWPLSKKTRMADSVLDNSGSLRELRNRVKIWKYSLTRGDQRL